MIKRSRWLTKTKIPWLTESCRSAYLCAHWCCQLAHLEAVGPEGIATVICLNLSFSSASPQASTHKPKNKSHFSHPSKSFFSFSRALEELIYSSSEPPFQSHDRVCGKKLAAPDFQSYGPRHFSMYFLKLWLNLFISSYLNQVKPPAFIYHVLTSAPLIKWSLELIITRSN